MFEIEKLIERLTSAFRQDVRYWRILNLRKLLYFGNILDTKEQKIFLTLAVLTLVSGVVFLSRIYFKTTLAVPDVGSSYTEGLLREPHTINPLFASQDTDRDIGRLIFSGLFSYNGRGEIEPDLAEGYEISPDGKTYTVRLKNDIYWHDGKMLDADDVLFTIQIIQNPQYKSVLRANWQGVLVEKLDQRTISFSLRTPYAPFIENLTAGILPRHLWEGISPDKILLNELNIEPIGSGPYSFDRLKKENNGSVVWYRLKRNPDYHGEGPYLRRITFKFYKSEDEMISALRKGDLDGFGPISASRLLEFNPKNVSLRAIPMPRIFGIFLNDDKSELLADLEVRKALAFAVNRREIAQKAISGGGIPSESPLPFSNLENDDKNITHPFDPELSREILQKQGWIDIDQDGFLEKETKKGRNIEKKALEFTLTTSDWPDLVRAAELTKNMFAEVGIKINLRSLPITELETNVLKPRDYEMLLFGQVYGYETDPFAFWHSSQVKDPGLNIALYASKRIDSILEEARTIPDRTKRQEKYADFSEILQRDLPAIFLFSQLYLYLLPPEIKGPELKVISLPTDRFNEINKWHIDTKRVFSF